MQEGDADLMLWAILAGLLSLNMLAIWRISLSKRWRRFTRPGASPAGIVIFVSPFIDQPRMAEIVLCRVAGGIAVCIGLSLCILALREFRKYGLSIGSLARKELRRPGVRPEAAAPHKLVMSGLYSAVRHPQQLGFMMFYAGYSLFFGATYCLYWLPLVVGAVYVAASVEERDLKEEFGREYAEYGKRVGMFLPRMVKK